MICLIYHREGRGSDLGKWGKKQLSVEKSSIAAAWHGFAAWNGTKTDFFSIKAYKTLLANGFPEQLIIDFELH